MKRIRTILLLAATAILVNCAGQKEGSGDEGTNERDLSTDAAVMEVLNAKHDGELDPDDVCIDRTNAFKKLILIGYFAHDRGCMGNDGFYKGKEIVPGEVIQEVLKDHGWDDESKRTALAIAWVQDVSFAWEGVLNHEPENFSDHSDKGYHEIMAEPTKDGIVVQCWVSEPVGMLCENNYRHVVITFSPNGEITDSEVTHRVNIPC